MDIFKDKDIMVTGGCGSIGSEIVRQLVSRKPKRIRVFDHNEEGHFKLNQEITSEKIRNLIGDVRDRDRVYRALEGVDIVFHAAALKHVPFCEYNPFEAVSTNVIGTKNMVEGAIDRNIKKFINVSTDKAVNPINTMGATKLLSEKVAVNAPVGISKIQMSCVRFGNVLNSTGSVIPIFKEQIKNGGPVTITSDEMTRFFMTIPQAVSLIFKAVIGMKGRETFILKMPALKISDLANVLIKELNKSGKKIELKTIGLRPGEKMHEDLFTQEELPYIKDAGEILVLRNSPYEENTLYNNQELKNELNSNYDLLTEKQIFDFLKKENII
ncbi:MAG: polysaccharide biosynthesis protein [Bacteroidia bacterium]|nr:polysaccharide biosynthesis protein [Bacteroidia bacterium]